VLIVHSIYGPLIPKSGGEFEMRIENIERLNPLFIRADVEIGGDWFKNALIAKRKGHYALILLEVHDTREIQVPESLNDQLNPYFGLHEANRMLTGFE
jgi:hypothetical protein